MTAPVQQWHQEHQQAHEIGDCAEIKDKSWNRVVNGKADAKLCPAGGDTRVYAKPAMTVCISKV